MKFLITALLPLALCFADFNPPQIPSHTQKQCIETICSHLGQTNCQRNDSFYSLVDACTRQLDIQCINTTFSKLSVFEKNEMNEVIKIAKSCQYVYPDSPSTASYYLSHFEQDELTEVTSLNSSLWMASPSCLSDAFDQLSVFDKDDLDEVRTLGNFCTGTYDRECFINECVKKSRFACDDASEVRSALYRCVSGPSKQDRRRL